MILRLLFFTLCSVPFLNGTLLFRNRRENLLNDFSRNSAPLLSPSIQEQKFNQKLDHFNQNDARTWKQVCNLIV